MSMKRIILFVFTVISLFILSSCASDNDKLIIQQAGSAVTLLNHANGTYRIEGIDGEFKNGIWTNEDYIYSPSGATYYVTNASGKKVGTVNLKLKEKAIKNELTIDLATYGDAGCTVSDDVDSVYIYSGAEKYCGAFVVIVDERDKPLCIEFQNVEIVNDGTVGVIYNLSDEAIDIKLNDSVVLSAGTAPNASGGSTVAGNMTSFLFNYVKTLFKSGSELSSLGSYALTGLTGDFKYIENYVNKLTDMAKASVDSLSTLLFGTNGATGASGVPAIISEGPVHLHGTNAKITGGSGGNGGNGSGSFLAQANGGNGGNAAPAIVASSIILSSGRSSVKLQAGSPGIGGNGQSNGHNGYRGNEAVDYECDYYFWR